MAMFQWVAVVPTAGSSPSAPAKTKSLENAGISSVFKAFLRFEVLQTLSFFVLFVHFLRVKKGSKKFQAFSGWLWDLVFGEI